MPLGSAAARQRMWVAGKVLHAVANHVYANVSAAVRAGAARCSKPRRRLRADGRSRARPRAGEAGSPWRFDATGPVSVALALVRTESGAPELVISANRDGGRCAELLRAAAADVLAAAMRGYAHAPRTRFLSPPMLAALRDLLRTSLAFATARPTPTRVRVRVARGAEDVHGEMKVVDTVLHGAYDGRPSYAPPAHRLLPPVVRLLPPRPS